MSRRNPQYFIDRADYFYSLNNKTRAINNDILNESIKIKNNIDNNFNQTASIRRYFDPITKHYYKIERIFERIPNDSINNLQQPIEKIYDIYESNNLLNDKCKCNNVCNCSNENNLCNCSNKNNLCNCSNKNNLCNCSNKNNLYNCSNENNLYNCSNENNLCDDDYKICYEKEVRKPCGEKVIKRKCVNLNGQNNLCNKICNCKDCYQKIFESNIKYICQNNNKGPCKKKCVCYEIHMKRNSCDECNDDYKITKCVCKNNKKCRDFISDSSSSCKKKCKYNEVRMKCKCCSDCNDECKGRCCNDCKLFKYEISEYSYKKCKNKLCTKCKESYSSSQ